MRTILLVAAAVGMFASGVAYAASGADVVKAKGCLNCHEMDKKKVGPSFKDIAGKYKGDKGAVATLSGKIKEGKGHPKSDASDADLKAALQYVLSAK